MCPQNTLGTSSLLNFDKLRARSLKMGGSELPSLEKSKSDCLLPPRTLERMRSGWISLGCSRRSVLPVSAGLLIGNTSLSCWTHRQRSWSSRKVKSGGRASCRLCVDRSRRRRTLWLPRQTELQPLIMPFLLLASLLHPCQCGAKNTLAKLSQQPRS